MNASSPAVNGGFSERGQDTQYSWEILLLMNVVIGVLSRPCDLASEVDFHAWEHTNFLGFFRRGQMLNNTLYELSLV